MWGRHSSSLYAAIVETTEGRIAAGREVHEDEEIQR
jgi:hypothetical protein